MLHTFFIYNVSLGDTIEFDDDYNLKFVKEPGGQCTFRIWFGDSDISGINNSMAMLENFDIFIEWYSKNLLAISVDLKLSKYIDSCLSDLEQNNFLTYEIGYF